MLPKISLMRGFTRYLIQTVLFGAVYVLNGQHVKFDHLDIKDGLSQKNVFCMKFDTEGFLWIGTLNGLNRYNGHEFEVFKPSIHNPHSISGNNCRVLAVGEDGDMWVITAGGHLDRFQSSSQQFEKISDSLFLNTGLSGARDMVFDESGILWIQFTNKLISFHPASGTVRTHPVKKGIRGIIRYQSQAMIYGKFGCATVGIKDGKLTTASVLEDPVYSVSHREGRSVYLLKESMIQIDSSNTVDTLIQHHQIPVDYRNNRYIPMALSGDEIWFGHHNKPARYRYKDSQPALEIFEFVPSNPNSFQGQAVSHIRADALGNIWLGTSKHGLNFFGKSKNRFSHISWDYSQDESKAIEPVRAICRTTTGDLWFGFDRRGIGIRHPDGHQSIINEYVDATGKKAAFGGIRSIMEDQNGKVWVGGVHGVGLYNPETREIESLEYMYQWSWGGTVYAMERYGTEEVIASSDGKVGIFNLSKKTQRIYDIGKKKPMLRVAIRDLDLDAKGGVWLGLDRHGIVYLNLDTEEVTHLSSKEIAISDEKVYGAKLIDPYLWIATNTGLNKLNTET
ncbi:MAG: two-component regulator propeller domain-containing protein, partial [Bacteroidota bacterium]